jgi:hypothetical protein
MIEIKAHDSGKGALIKVIYKALVVIHESNKGTRIQIKSCFMLRNSSSLVTFRRPAWMTALEGWVRPRVQLHSATDTSMTGPERASTLMTRTLAQVRCVSNTRMVRRGEECTGVLAGRQEV